MPNTRQAGSAGLILASASPRRAALLKEAGVAFTAIPCPLREPSHRPNATSPYGWAEALAYFKARAVSDRNRERWVLGADTVVLCRGEMLGQPTNVDDARRMLLLQAGYPSEVVTGVSLVRVTGFMRRLVGHQVTRVWMRDARAAIEAYLAGGDWRGKAGAYGIQDVGDRLVERVAGSFSNVVGLPVERVLQMLYAVGLAQSPQT